MSDQTPTPQPDQQPGSPWSAFAGAFSDLDAGESGEQTPDESQQTPAPADPVVPTADPTPGEAAPVVPAPVDAATPVVPAWSGQQEAGRAFKDLNEQLAFWKGVAEGKIAPPAVTAAPEQTKPETDPEPDPDDFTDETAYWKAVREYDRNQVKKELQAEFLPIKQQQEQLQLNASLDAAEASVGQEKFQHYSALVAQHIQNYPSVEKDLMAAPNLGKAFVKLGKLLAGEREGAAPAPTAVAPAVPAQPAAVPAAPASPAVDFTTLAQDPAMVEAVLRAQAAKNAAAGTIPPTLPSGPRGHGPSGGNGGVPDATLTVESVRAMKSNPEQLRAVAGQLAAQMLI